MGVECEVRVLIEQPDGSVGSLEVVDDIVPGLDHAVAGSPAVDAVVKIERIGRRPSYQAMGNADALARIGAYDPDPDVAVGISRDHPDLDVSYQHMTGINEQGRIVANFEPVGTGVPGAAVLLGGSHLRRGEGGEDADVIGQGGGPALEVYRRRVRSVSVTGEVPDLVAARGRGDVLSARPGIEIAQSRIDPGVLGSILRVGQ